MSLASIPDKAGTGPTRRRQAKELRDQLAGRIALRHRGVRRQQSCANHHMRGADHQDGKPGATEDLVVLEVAQFVPRLLLVIVDGFGVVGCPPAMGGRRPRCGGASRTATSQGLVRGWPES